MGFDQLFAAELLWSLMNGKTGSIAKTTFTPQKPAFPLGAKNAQPLPRSTPEAQGVSSAMIAAMIRELAGYPALDMHQLMIVRHGSVISECSFYPYKTGVWHASYSLCKSITGLAVGMLVDDGKLKLTDPITGFFKNRSSRILQRNVTIEHLLTMTSGVDFHESGVFSGDNWVKSYLSSMVSGTPGTVFDYNSLNSYMLSAIVTQVTGESMMDFLAPRLWKPLGISNVFWESCPKGITKGGWGLFICPEDVAKIGQMMLQHGSWQGEQIISQDWLAEMTRKQVEVPADAGNGYGFHVWTADRPGGFAFNGMLGQNLIAYPDIDMLIVTNAGSNELFQNSLIIDTVQKYFGVGYQPADKLPANKKQYEALKKTEAETIDGSQTVPIFSLDNLKKQTQERIESTVENQYKKLLNKKSYDLESVRAGLYPLMLQVFHNNFTYGVRALSFQKERSGFYVTFYEGGDEIKLLIGFGKAPVSEVRINGESYLVATQGEFAYNEDGNLTLKLDIAFIEEAVRRKIKIFFKDDRIETKWGETPGIKLIVKGLRYVLTDSSDNFLTNAFNNRVSPDLVLELVRATLDPLILGTLSEKEDDVKKLPESEAKAG